jgi:hypothetical protein
MTVEHRKKHGHVLQDAAELYLNTVARRDRLQALVVSNEHGFLVACAPSGYDAHWLAALGCACASRIVRGEVLGTLIAEMTHGAALYAAAIKSNGETLYLTSIGGRVSRPMEAADTLGRILSRGAS